MKEFKVEIALEFQGRTYSFETYIDEENEVEAKEYARERFLATLDVETDAQLLSEEENEYEVTVIATFEAQSCEFDTHVVAENKEEAENVVRDMFLSTMSIETEAIETDED